MKPATFRTPAISPLGPHKAHSIYHVAYWPVTAYAAFWSIADGLRDHLERRLIDVNRKFPVRSRWAAFDLKRTSCRPVVLMHNHPGGDSIPSRAGIEMTRVIVEIAKQFGLAIQDHIIVGKQGHASLKETEADLNHVPSLAELILHPKRTHARSSTERSTGARTAVVPAHLPVARNDAVARYRRIVI